MFIAETLDSVLNQTYQNLELIVVNDGSTDCTKSIVELYCLKDSRVHLINQENKGCSAAKNTGLAAANGDFIQYLDADDILSPEKLYLQFKAISQNPMSIAICKTKIFKNINQIDNAEELDTKYLYSTRNSLEFLKNLYGINTNHKLGGMIQPNAFLISKKLAHKIGEWNTNISPCLDEDGEYFCRAILYSNEIILTNGINYYRKIDNVDSLSKIVSSKRLVNSFKSLLLKKEHLLNIEDNTKNRELMATHITHIVYQFGSKYLELASMAKIELSRMGIFYWPKVGTTKFRIMRALFGFENTLKIRRFLIK